MKKADQARSIAAKLSTQAKNKGIPYQLVSTTFLIERLLARLLLDNHLAENLVFKGGYVGLRVYESARYTVDLDALLNGADLTKTLERVTKAAQKDIGDCAWFVLESQVDLQTQGEYGGIRQVFRAGLGEPLKDLKRAQVVHFDIGIGDPITPGPVQIKTKSLLGDSELSWLIYPVETIVAEKLHTLIDRGGNNSRAKDVYDLHFYLPRAKPDILITAIERCFAFRNTPVPEDLCYALSKIETKLLEKGWKSATASLKDTLGFKEAFLTIIKELRRVFPTTK